MISGWSIKGNQIGPIIVCALRLTWNLFSAVVTVDICPIALMPSELYVQYYISAIKICFPHSTYHMERVTHGKHTWTLLLLHAPVDGHVFIGVNFVRTSMPTQKKPEILVSMCL
jgi:hypothetical protein